MKIVSLGELLVEIFRKEVEYPFYKPGDFVGPYPSGAPAIFIHALANLGCETGFFATIGDDDFGKCLIDKLKNDNVDTSRITILKDYTTGVAFTLFFKDGSRKFIYHSRNAAVGQFGSEHLDKEYLKKTGFLHICGNVLGISDSTREACYTAIKIVSESGGRIIFDPNIRPELMSLKEIWDICEPVVKSSYAIFPSGHESEMLTAVKGEANACRKLLEFGPSLVCLKQGSKGSSIFTKEKSFSVGSFNVNEVDPTGAGDCYDAGIVYGLVNDWPLEKTAVFANALGALTVTKRGAMEASISLDEVMDFIIKNGGFNVEIKKIG